MQVNCTRYLVRNRQEKLLNNCQIITVHVSSLNEELYSFKKIFATIWARHSVAMLRALKPRSKER